MGVAARLKQLAGESVIYGLAGVAQRFLVLFMVPLYTRLFSPADFGILALVNATTSLVTIFAVLALDNSAHRWYWDTEDEADRRRTVASWAWCQLTVASVLGLGIFLSAEQLAELIVENPVATEYFQIIALEPLLMASGMFLNAWLRMQRRAKATAVFGLGTSFFTLGLTAILLLVFDWGLEAIFWARLAGGGLRTGIAVLLMGSWLSPRYFDRPRLWELLRFAAPMIPASLSLWMIQSSDRFFIQHFEDGGEVGLYQIGTNLATAVSMLTAAFTRAWSPFAFSIHKEPDAREVYASVLLVYMWISCAVACAVTLYAEELLLVLTTAEYLPAATVVGPLAVSFALSGVTFIAALGPAIVKTSRPTATAVMISAVLNVVLNALLIPQWGKEGAAVATLASQMVVPVYLFRASQSLYPIPYRFGTAAGIVAAAGGFMAAGAMVDTGHWLVDIAVKAVLLLGFVGTPIALGVVSVAQIKGWAARRQARRAAPDDGPGSEPADAEGPDTEPPADS